MHGPRRLAPRTFTSSIRFGMLPAPPRSWRRDLASLKTSSKLARASPPTKEASPPLLRSGAPPARLHLSAMTLVRQTTRLGGLTRLGRLSLLGRPRPTLQLRLQLAQATCAILELTAALARGHHDAARHMTHANRRIGRVHALATRARRAKHLHFAFARKLLGRQRCPHRVVAMSHIGNVHATHHTAPESPHGALAKTPA